MNWEAWAIDMCSLLDRIEAVADEDEAGSAELDTIIALCRGRFDLARKHGVVVEELGEGVGTVQ